MSTGIPNLNTRMNRPSEADAARARAEFEAGDTSGDAPENPSQLRGHAKYVKGAASDAIGNLTASTSWKESGHRAKADGIAEMRAAKAQTDSDLHSDSYPNRNPNVLKAEGRAQNTTGRTLGCLGMEERGGEKVRAAEGLDMDRTADRTVTDRGDRMAGDGVFSGGLGVIKGDRAGYDPGDRNRINPPRDGTV